jgi:tRNA(Ile)-lysidine synthase
VRAAADQTRESVEMAARRLRHGFLARAAHEHGASRIALAHHAGDQTELFFLRLFRGAGGAGLAGMRPLGPSPADPGIELIRPLLEVPKSQLLEFAAAHGLAFQEDASNANCEIPRNRVRHELLPKLRGDFTPALDWVVQRTATLVGAEADFVHAEAQRWLQASRRKPFETLHVALQRAIVREQLWQLGHEGDFELVERLRASGDRVSAGADLTLRRQADGNVTAAAARVPEFSAAAESGLLWPSRGEYDFGPVHLQWSIPRSTRPPSRAIAGRECFDGDRVGAQINLRHWQPGDRFQPLGFRSPSKLQDLFVNRKIPAAKRRELLLATTATGEIFWVEGLPPGETFKVATTTRRGLVLRWRRAR